MRLALPLVAFNLGTQLMAAVDTALSGRINALAQGATGLGGVLFFAGALFGMGITMGLRAVAKAARTGSGGLSGSFASSARRLC